jgi:hypothetical protein
MAREAPAQELVALQGVLDARAEALEAASRAPGARELLAPAARSAAGADRLYAELEHALERPEFADVLRREQAQRAAAAHPAPASAASSCAHAEVLRAEWWEGGGDDGSEAGADEAGGAGAAAEGAEPSVDAENTAAEVEEATGAYVAVSHADAVDALAAFLAAYLAALPQARGVVGCR